MYLFQCNSDYIMWFQHKIMFIYEKNKNLGNGPGGIYFRHTDEHKLFNLFVTFCLKHCL